MHPPTPFATSQSITQGGLSLKAFVRHFQIASFSNLQIFKISNFKFPIKSKIVNKKCTLPFTTP